MNGTNEFQALLGELQLDALLVTAPANVRYLSGFTTPNDARVLLAKEGAWLITDKRYQTQAAEESRVPVEVNSDWLGWVADRTADMRLGVEADDLSVAYWEQLNEQRGDGSIVALRDIFRERRMVKDAAELAKLRLAARITDDAFSHILGFLKPGISEVDVALELERVMRSAGAEAKSFDIVVASGLRSAMPHGVASPKIIERGDLVTLDFGAMVEGYHADMTRAVGIGELNDELRSMYDAVLEAEVASLDAVRPGRSGSELDEIAREVLRRHGLENFFAHSLGHGVGLEIHEGPKLSPKSDDVLAPGMAVTIEPGVYMPGTGGVRIEDLAVVTDDGYERLSLAPKELIIV